MHTIWQLATSATVLGFTLAGCSGGSSPLGPDGAREQAGLSASVTAERPWSGQCVIGAIFTSPTTLLITGTCQLAHLGRATVVATQDIGAPNPVTGIIPFTNNSTYTAANGDELHSTNAGFATPTATGLDLSGIETAVGGTGRFANASGTATLTGTVQFTGPASTSATYSFRGRLEY